MLFLNMWLWPWFVVLILTMVNLFEGLD